MRQHNNPKAFSRLCLAFWILEVLSCLLAIAILGVIGSASNGISKDLRFPSVPRALVYNIALVSSLQ